jgi:uncharacterized protein
MSLEDLVATIARGLVDEPDAVDVQTVDGESAPLIELRVSPDDIGKVIGRDGRTAQSIRTLLAAASNKTGQRVHLDIVD